MSTGTQISDMTIEDIPEGGFVPFIVTDPATGLSTQENYRADIGTALADATALSTDAALQAVGLSIDAAPYGWDDFDRPNEVLNGSADPQGRVYSVTGAGAATMAIVSKEVVSPNGLNCYASTAYGSQLSRVEIQFRFVATGISGPDLFSRPCTLIVQSSADNLQDMQIHCQITMQGFQLDTYRTGVQVPAVLSGGWDIQPDVAYTVIALVSGTSVTIIDPFGKVYSGTAPLNSQFVGSVRTFQIFDGGVSATYAYEPHILLPTVGNGIAASRALATGAPPAEMGAWRGEAFSQRQFPTEFTATTNAYYRVLTQKIFPGGFGCIGVVEIYVQQLNGLFDSLLLSINAFSGAPIIEQIARQNFGSPISAIRASLDGAGLVGVDILFASAASSNATVGIRTIGYFTPVPVPVTGATSLGSPTVFVPQTSTPSLTVVMAEEGYHRVAIQTSFAGFALITNFRFTAVSAIAATYGEGTVAGLPGGPLMVGQGLVQSNVGALVTNYRVSRTTNQVRLDVYADASAVGNPITLNIEFDGVYALSDGAYSPTALAGANKTLALAANSGVTIADPTGGGTIDAEARAAIVSILNVLENRAIINT